MSTGFQYEVIWIIWDLKLECRKPTWNLQKNYFVLLRIKNNLIASNQKWFSKTVVCIQPKFWLTFLLRFVEHYIRTTSNHSFCQAILETYPLFSAYNFAWSPKHVLPNAVCMPKAVLPKELLKPSTRIFTCNKMSKHLFSKILNKKECNASKQLPISF